MLIVVTFAAAAIYVVMTLRLYAHMRALTRSEETDEPPHHGVVLYAYGGSG